MSSKLATHVLKSSTKGHKAPKPNFRASLAAKSTLIGAFSPNLTTRSICLELCAIWQGGRYDKHSAIIDIFSVCMYILTLVLLSTFIDLFSTLVMFFLSFTAP